MLPYTIFAILSFISTAFGYVIHYQPEAVHLSYGGEFYYVDIYIYIKNCEIFLPNLQ